MDTPDPRGLGNTGQETLAWSQRWWKRLLSVLISRKNKKETTLCPVVPKRNDKKQGLFLLEQPRTKRNDQKQMNLGLKVGVGA